MSAGYRGLAVQAASLYHFWLVTCEERPDGEKTVRVFFCQSRGGVRRSVPVKRSGESLRRSPAAGVHPSSNLKAKKKNNFFLRRPSNIVGTIGRTCPPGKEVSYKMVVRPRRLRPHGEFAQGRFPLHLPPFVWVNALSVNTLWGGSPFKRFPFFRIVACCRG